MNDTIEGEIVSDLLPFQDGDMCIPVEVVEKLLLRTAQLAYEAAETKRQSFATTPDGLRDKTICGYQPVPYHTALSQSQTLQDVPHTGTEHWQGDSINPIPSTCADRLFLDYPRPILLSERVNKE